MGILQLAAAAGLFLARVSAAEASLPREITAAAAAAGEWATDAVPALTSAPIPNAYIVVLKQDADLARHLAFVSQVHVQSTSSLPGTQHQYEFASFKGYAGQYDAGTVEKLKSHPEVQDVSQDAIVTISAAETPPKTCKHQALDPAASSGMWGLGRVSHEGLPPTAGLGWGEFVWSSECPAGSEPTYAYVVDTGINFLHAEFEGRATAVFVADPDWSYADTCGHGTHVAGTIAGATFGVSRNSFVRAVKVLESTRFGSCSGSWSQVIAGLQFALTDASRKVRGKDIRSRSVVNLSLGGLYNSALNRAVETLVQAGMTVVVAAGNNGDNACFYSPSSAAGALVVGASTINDTVAGFSNTGCCVNVWAPGLRIRSAFYNDSLILSGTSMAAPHVAGVVLYNKCRRGYATPAKDIRGLNDHRYNVNGHLTGGGLCLASSAGACRGASNSSCAANRLAYNRQCER